MNSLQKELESAKWMDKKLLIDIKCDGLRMSLGKINGKPFCYVDPDTLKEKSPDVSSRLPQIIKELESFPDNTVLDGEFIAIKDNETLHRTTANSLLNGTNFTPESLSNISHIFIFDVLFFDGVDIRSHPLHERVEYLQRLKSTDHIWIERNTTSLEEESDGYFIQGNNLEDINLIIDRILSDKIGRPSHIAEGIMIKLLDHQYEFPTNHGWGKLKKYYEVDCVVWDKKLVKGQDDVFNYFLGISVPNEIYTKLPNNIKVPEKLLTNYGKTDNTKIKCEIGEVLRVASEEVLKYTENDVVYYRGYVNRALETIPEKNISDNYSVLDKLSSFQPRRVPLDEIERINQSESTLTQEEIISSPSGSKVPNEEEPGEEELKSKFKEGSLVMFNNKIAKIIKLIG